MARGTVRSIPAVIVLTIITCGLYGLVWYYEVSRELQEVTGQTDTSPGLEVLLIVLTCGLYVVYWWFKYGKMLAEAQSIKSEEADLGKKYEALSLQFRQPKETIEKYYTEHQEARETLLDQVRNEKVIEFLKQNAKIK